MTTIKKKLVYGGGLAAFAVVLLMMLPSGLVIYGDGDKSCEGTLRSPCVSHIVVKNPTYSDVVINGTLIDKAYLRFEYPGERKHIYEAVMWYELYKKVGRKWERINYSIFDEQPTIVFPARSTTQFKLVGYKYNRKDVVKWTINFGDIFVLDPLWNSTGTEVINDPSLEPENAFADSTLNCSMFADMYNVTANYTNGTVYTTQFAFFRNGVYMENYTGYVTNNITPKAVYSPINVTQFLTVGDSWYCRVKMYTTGIENVSVSDIYQSNTVIINNSAPTVSLIYPENDTIAYSSHGDPVTLEWTGSDADLTTVSYKLYIQYDNDPSYTMVQNGTGTTYDIENNSINATWYVIATDGLLNTTSGINKFNFSFLNWSVNYGNGISSFIIRSTSSYGYFYPDNQTNATAVFNITNYDSDPINVSVNLTSPLPTYIDLYLYNLTYYLFPKTNDSYVGGTLGQNWTDGNNLIDGDLSTFAYHNGAVGIYAIMNFTVPTGTCGTPNLTVYYGSYLGADAGSYTTPFDTTCYDSADSVVRIQLSANGEIPSGHDITDTYCLSPEGSSKLLARLHTPYINETTVTFPVCGSDSDKITKSVGVEPARTYTRFNDSTTTKTKYFNGTRSNQTYDLQPIYRSVNVTFSTITMYNVVNTSTFNTTQVRIYANETLIYDFQPTTEGLNVSLPNLTITSNTSYSFACPSQKLQYNIVNITDSTVYPCSPYLYISANQIYFDNVTINGDERGYSGGGAGAGGNCDTCSYEADGGYGGDPSGNRGSDGPTTCSGYDECTGAGGGGAGGMLGLGYRGGRGGRTEAVSSGGAGGYNGVLRADQTTIYATPTPGGGAGGGGGGGGYQYGGYDGDSGTDGNPGGAGVKIEGVTVDLRNLTVSVNGGAGGQGGYGGHCCSNHEPYGGGGNGGSGGEVIVVSTGTIYITGTYFSTQGGAAGYGPSEGEDGQAGEGGRVKLWYTSPVLLDYYSNTGTGGTEYEITNSSVLTYTNELDIASVMNSYLQGCTEITTPAHHCVMRIRLEGINSNTTLYNYNSSQAAQTGSVVEKELGEVSSLGSKYIWARAFYNYSSLGAKFNFTWTATK